MTSLEARPPRGTGHIAPASPAIVFFCPSGLSTPALNSRASRRRFWPHPPAASSFFRCPSGSPRFRRPPGTTRWQGTASATGLVAQARATALADCGLANLPGDLGVGARLARRESPAARARPGAETPSRARRATAGCRWAGRRPPRAAQTPRLRQSRPVAAHVGRRELLPEPLLERGRVVAERDAAQAAIGRRDQHHAEPGR